jgi:hypothetical protein
VKSGTIVLGSGGGLILRVPLVGFVFMPTAVAAPTATVTLAQPKDGRPDELDFLFVEGDRRELFKGWAEWDGDELRVSFSKPDADRPKEVKATDSVYHYRFS